MRGTRLVVPAILASMSVTRPAVAQKTAGAQAGKHAISVNQSVSPVVSITQHLSNPGTSMHAGTSGASGAVSQFTTFTVKIADISHELATWMKEAVDNGRQATSRPVDILELDAGGQITADQKMTRADVAHITLPALDASGKAAASLSLELSTVALTQAGGGGKVSMAQGLHKTWNRTDYHVMFSGVGITQNVSHVDAIDVAPGAKCPGPIMVVDGMADIDNAKKAMDAHTTTSGEIEYLASDRTTVVVRARFTGLRVTQVDKRWAAAAEVRFACTAITLDFPSTP